jgi:hypothetical protein
MKKTAKTRNFAYLQTDKISLAPDQLNKRELKVLTVLQKAQAAMDVKDLARACFPGQRTKPGTYGTEKGGGTAVAYRTVLNSVRRLVAAGFVKRPARGVYVAKVTEPVETQQEQAASEPATEQAGA